MSDAHDGGIRVRIEIPKGSRNKYEYDEEHDEIVLDRRLHASVTYPTEYGAIPGTISEDGDELDAMVCVTEATFPGCVIIAKPVALLRMTKDGEPNHKVLGVPFSDPSWNRFDDVDDLPQNLGTEIMHFFRAYTSLEPAGWEIEGWAPREAALEEVAAARRRYEGRADAP